MKPTRGALENQISFIFILNAPSMDGKADAASHSDAVYKRDVWNPTRTRQVVELQCKFKFRLDDINMHNIYRVTHLVSKNLPLT